ncbi:MAG: TOBE domain-containing protein [Candidatus Bathyarchaeota archaeon]|nr:TOBE domain-containing protein [Candidatus Bathyarchaeota archaeon]
MHVLGKGGVSILKAIKTHGSITEAAKHAGVSYKYAWDRVSDMEKAFGEPFLKTRRGGKMGGGGAELTDTAQTLIKDYDRIEKYLERVLKDNEYWEMIGLKISARNRLKGIVDNVEKGPVTSKVKIRIETPVTITAVITKEAVEDLDIKPGEKVEAVIKSTEVMVAKE